MDNLKSLANEELDLRLGGSGPEENDLDDNGLLEDLIKVKIYFYGSDKPLRTRVFPQDK